MKPRLNNNENEKEIMKLNLTKNGMTGDHDDDDVCGTL